MRDGVLRRLRLRGALALSGNSRWGAVLMMMNAAPIDSAGQNTMIIFRQRYRLWATRVCLAGQDAGENGGGVEDGADAAGKIARRKEIKFR